MLKPKDLLQLKTSIILTGLMTKRVEGVYEQSEKNLCWSFCRLHFLENENRSRDRDSKWRISLVLTHLVDLYAISVDTIKV